MKARTNRRLGMTMFKRISILTLGMALVFAITAELDAKPRKLSLGAYISGAKIAHGPQSETPRPHDAIALLDSCIMWYGIVPEAYFWKTVINSELARQSADSTRLHYLNEMVKSADSLDYGCDKNNKEVKKKYKEECEQYQITTDSIRADWFAEFFNRANAARIEVQDELSVSLEQSTDSAERASLQSEIEDKYDEAETYFEMAGLVHPKDIRYLINLSEVYVQRGKPEKSLPLLQKAAEVMKQKDADQYFSMMNQMAYTLFEMQKYDSAAAIFKSVASEVDDKSKIGLYRNIVAAYSNTQNTDSIVAYNQKILAIDSGDAKALATLGGLWFNKVIDLNKSRSEASQKPDSAKIKEIDAKMVKVADSAKTYLKAAFQSNPTDTQSVQNYAFSAMMVNDLESANAGFEKLAELKPTDTSTWIYLGDNYVRLGKFEKAIVPYEKATQLNPSNAAVWQSLLDLYKSNNMPEKAKKAQAQLDKLKS